VPRCDVQLEGGDVDEIVGVPQSCSHRIQTFVIYKVVHFVHQESGQSNGVL